jgi:hypothetical protein
MQVRRATDGVLDRVLDSISPNAGAEGPRRR